MHSVKGKKLVRLLERISPVAVALSGGLDSSVVAKAASLASKKSIAVTIDDYTVPRKDILDAKCTAKMAGIKHVIVKSSPSKKVLENPKDRCFYCKSHNYGLVAKIAKKFKIKTVVDGANADDMLEYRPGMRAAKALGIRSPLLELGFGKNVTRKLAKEFGLLVWDKPSSACLSSRIPHGERITKQKLGKVERAELEIKRLAGIEKVRVR
ncbi:MAG: ATP-dependent sacrificial sulfur transferase LarE, partial [Candidatus Micrarchaeota archaeon]